jgi:polyisoprenyl-phosphate glycosyltransferase
MSGERASTPALSVAVPCYNEASVLAELYRRVTAACRTVCRDYEIVLVNDGSNDSTWEIICDLARHDVHVIGVNLTRNRGHQIALTAGLAHCRGDRILIIDADLQDPPELLPKMWALMDAGADVIYGKRQSRQGETKFKTLTARLFYRLITKLTDVPIPEDTGDFRLISRRVADVLRAMPEQHRFVRGMIAWIGFRQVPILYDRAPRFAGTTKYPLRKMVDFAFDAIFSFSAQPLRLGLYLGLSMCTLSILLIAVAVIWWLVFNPLPGWTSLMIAVLFVGGVQTILLGVIGEYLSRLYQQSKGRPLYVIQGVVGADKDGVEFAGSASAHANAP